MHFGSSDLQLAIALQQQEFEEQQPQQSVQPTVASGSGLITGPQASLRQPNRCKNFFHNKQFF